ncbi:conserved hypothetical protein [Ricinus communis]|uniref:Uncharacterized protein n=1 Tax=Ricinus communis TaxID=3988 RepID=B9T2K8_RICCO|nr:conserved hypothetical protein [Ricinus communis]
MNMAVSYSPCSLLSSNDNQQEKNMEMGRNLRIKAECGNLPMRAWRSMKMAASRFLRRKQKLVVGLARRVMISATVQIKRKVSGRGSSGKSSVLLNYDINSYSKNFDDGRWQQEEGLSITGLDLLSIDMPKPAAWLCSCLSLKNQMSLLHSFLFQNYDY